MTNILLETLNLKKSFKHTSGDITLFDNLNLKIKEGTQIRFSENSYILLLGGKINFQGSEKYPIMLTGLNDNLFWRSQSHNFATNFCNLSNLDTFFKNILMELKKIYLLPTETLSKISYNELLSQTESFLNVFIYKDKKIDEKERSNLQTMRRHLVDALSLQPQVPSHSDFERRNMIKKNDKIYLIDFQDLHVGPVGIDLASLFYDHENYYDEKIIQTSVEAFVQENDFLEKEKIYNYIYTALAHRCMRIIGTFINYFNEGKLHNRKNDLEKFLKRLVFALDMINMNIERDIIKKLI